MRKKNIPGLYLVAQERFRQVGAEGYTPEHDAQHTHGELAQAAACYCIVKPGPAEQVDLWPFEIDSFKRSGAPQPSLRDLMKAGALIAAEIDRRIAAGEEPPVRVGAYNLDDYPAFRARLESPEHLEAAKAIGWGVELRQGECKECGRDADITYLGLCPPCFKSLSCGPRIVDGPLVVCWVCNAIYRPMPGQSLSTPPPCGHKHYGVVSTGALLSAFRREMEG